jgi:hypothetical protein
MIVYSLESKMKINTMEKNINENKQATKDLETSNKKISELNEVLLNRVIINILK